MADPNIGQTVTSAWESIVKAQPEDNIFPDHWLLFKLRQGQGMKTIDGGRIIEAHLEYAMNTTVSSYSDLEPISTTRVDVFDSAQFNWKEYAGTVVQSELEDAINQGSGGKFDLLAAKLENLNKTFDDTLNEDCFSDGTTNSSKVIGGLQHIVATAPATGTVGGINRANFSFWRNKQASGVQTTASFDNLRAVMRSIYNQCSNGVAGDHPSFAVTTRTVFEGFEGLLLANERFTDKSDAEGGFKNETVKFKGCSLAYDDDCTASSLYFLNPKYLKLAVMKGRWKKMLKEVDPANQTATIRRCVTIANMITTNARMLGVVTAIT